MLLFSFVLVLVCLVYILVQVWREHKVNLKMFNDYPVGSRYQVFEKTINDIDYYTIFCLTFRGRLLILFGIIMNIMFLEKWRIIIVPDLTKCKLKTIVETKLKQNLKT